MLADSPILCDILICNILYQNEVKKMGEKRKDLISQKNQRISRKE